MNTSLEIVENPRLDHLVAAVLERKTRQVVLLDVHKMTTVADIFVICSAQSNRQVSAVADHIVSTLKKKGIKPLNVEGKKDGHWVLMDYGDMIVHVFFEPLRTFYDLESLWADARPITTKALMDHQKNEPRDYDDE